MLIIISGGIIRREEFYLWQNSQWTNSSLCAKAEASSSREARSTAA